MFGVRREADKRATAASGCCIQKAAPRLQKPKTATDMTFVLPERDESKTLHPGKQKGLVLRFESCLPSERFFKKHSPNAARIDVPLHLCEEKTLAPYIDKVSVVLPRTVFLNELDSVKKQLKTAYRLGIRHATISSLNQITLCEGFYLHGDYAFNVVNRNTLALLEGYSFSSVMISPETDARFPRGSKCALEYIGYGRTPLMYTRTCIIANLNGCPIADKNAASAPPSKKLCRATLTDRTGAKFPIIGAPNHTNIVYNSLVGYRLDRRSELKKCGIGLITLLFTDETEAKMESVIALAESKQKPNFEYTRR
jgi:hypothetical protein